MNYAKISQVAHYAPSQVVIWQKSWIRAMNGFQVERE